MHTTRIRAAMPLLTAAIVAAGCAGHQGTAGGEVISASDAAATVVLHVRNLGTNPVTLNTVQDGKSLFVGSVPAQDTASILLDPMLFPTARLFIRATARAGGERVMVGPLAAGKGDEIDLTVEEGLIGSQAQVRR